MPEIEITADQRDRLHALQEDLARDVVGKYGHVRPRDAIEYLLDRYDEDDDADPETETSEVETVPDATPDATPDAMPAPDPTDAAVESAAVDGDVAEGADAETADAGDGEATARVVGGAAGTDEGGESTASTPADDAAGGDDMLNAMMNLLDTHDDKWGEASGDERYAVDLPDGSTEHARTKDDVKALLFKHYR